jgi:putative methionine-R-sulfoxide reductase with GAF domain
MRFSEGVHSRTLVRAAEVWTPSRDGNTIELTSGAYGGLKEVERASQQLRANRGVGLSGRVWETGNALVLNHFHDEAGSARADAALRSGLAAGVGIPIYDGGELVSVCVLLCGDPSGACGAVEIWEPEEVRDCLGLSSGYFGAYDGFRRLSSLMKFPRGVGLPGQVWETGRAIVFDDLSGAGPFMRAAAAETYGFTAGLGIPVFKRDVLSSVLLLLSVKGIPIARGFEVWVPDIEDRRLSLASAAYDGAVAMRAAGEGLMLEPGQGLPGKVWSTRRPRAVDAFTEEFERSSAARQAELSIGVGIPIIEGDKVRAVVVLLN